ncbi:unnamed protein product [Meloidogyne enterolobii]|uniref:Uncharacterized protein n=1 Tax=Meloidogyne enterolobii TaxID=390850 RepID=A0ACB0Z6Z2_MELEN
MESEADFGNGLLSTEVGHRRRSTSVSDDYSVQKTNDDATECKFVAVQVILFRVFYYKSLGRMIFLHGEGF